ncbi:MAG: alpha-N-acetylglucosaminidase C-terminal domain-containing protein, partial [Armatimonadetes bacterium]|nr:alpha-N-acetylglucosaminidase C-terminal domain-containing protein [Armatimonadota bacterium]
ALPIPSLNNTKAINPKLSVCTDYTTYKEIRRRSLAYLLGSGSAGLGGYGTWFAGTAEDWKGRIDWAAKNRLNQFLVNGNPAPAIFMKKVHARLGISPDPVPTARDKAEVELYHEILSYARKLDIDGLSCLAIAPVASDGFRKKFPNAKYVQTSWLDLSAPVYHISPMDPLYKEFYKTAAQVWREMFPESGHVYYGGGPYSETKFHNIGREETERILIESNSVYMQAVLEADPKAVVQMSGWCWAFDPGGFWTEKVTTELFKGIPQDNYIIWDLVCDANPQYQTKKVNYWFGRPWMFGVLHSYGGDDEIHGDLAGTLKRAIDVVNDPKARNCVGFAQTAELFGYSMLYQDFLWQVAWDPRKVDVDSYLKDFASRRYGAEVGPKLVPRLMKLADTVYGPRGGSRELHQHRPYLENWAPRWDLAWGILSPPESIKTANVLEGFLKALLAHEKQLGEEKVHQNDLVDFTRQYITEVANVRRICMDGAFVEGDIKRFDTEVRLYNELLDQMESVLSARPEYRAQHISDLQETNPFGPKDGGRGLRDGGLTFAVSVPGIIDYQARGMYELLKFYDRPRINAYTNYLRDRMTKDVQSAPPDELDNLYVPLERRWVEEGFDKNDAKPYVGSAVEACRAAADVASRICAMSWESKSSVPEGFEMMQNIGIGHCVEASSVLNSSFALAGVSDGSPAWGTGWASEGVPVGGTIPEQWLLFDFEHPRSVAAVQYFIEDSPIGAAASRYCKDYVVEVSDDKKSWRIAATGTFPPGATTPRASLPVIRLEPTVNTRYLRFRMLNSYVGNIIVVGELAIWGR